MASRPAISINTTGGVGDVDLSVTGLTGTGLSLVDNGDGSGEITGTILNGAASSSPYSVSVSASDSGDGSDTEAFSITVLERTFSTYTYLGSITDVLLDNCLAIDVNPSDQLIYVVAQNADSLVVIDVSDPSSPSITGSVVDATDLNVARGVVYDASRDLCFVSAVNRLTVVDVSTPASPSIIGTYADSTRLAQVREVSYDSARQICWISSGAGLGYITGVDVSTPATPVLEGSVTNGNLDDTRGNFYDPVNEYVWATSLGGNRITGVDTSTSTSPAVDGQLTGLTTALGVQVSADGDTAYVTAAGTNDLVSVNVSTPATPTELDRLSRASFTSGYCSIDTASSVLHVAADGEIAAVDISNPSSLSLIETDDAGGAAPTLVGIKYSPGLGLVFATDQGADTLHIWSVT